MDASSRNELMSLWNDNVLWTPDSTRLPLPTFHYKDFDPWPLILWKHFGR
jgi:hypothetical protein